MKTAVKITLAVVFAALRLHSQAPAPPASPTLSAILTQVQESTGSANVNISKLRIEKWKTDPSQRQQLQQMAESVQKNIANAVPGLIGDVQNSKGGVAASFKLYHNLNVLYEYLSGLADAAGSLGKKEEYEPLAADAASLDTARQSLSIYIEQAAVRMETANRPPPVPARSQMVPVPGKVVVIDEDDAPPKAKATSKSGTTPTKKKTSPADAKKPVSSPSPTPSQTAGAPH